MLNITEINYTKKDLSLLRIVLILTKQCLEVLFHVIFIILEHQCIDQLPGGKYWNTNANIKSMVQNVLSANKVSEDGFGTIDLLMRTRPNASCQLMLALTMWSWNGTVEWLNSLSADKNQKMLKKPQEKRMKKTGNL